MFTNSSLHSVINRRAFLRAGGLGFGALALTELFQREAMAAAKSSHFAARAKHVIYLHMIGAPSHLDLFDYKPELVKHNGEACPESLLKGRRFAFIGGQMNLAGSPFKFQKH